MSNRSVRLWDAMRVRWRSLVHRGQVETELDEELRFHFEHVAEEYMRQGMAPEEARRRARLEHGGVQQIKEGCREARGWTLLENLFRDVVYACRGFRKSPAFACAAIGTIALGVGVNTALFSLVYSLVFRPLPVKDPGAIRNVFLRASGTGPRSTYGTPYFISFAEFNHMREHSRTADLAGLAEATLSWNGAPGGSVHGQLVSDTLLPLIGGRPIVGRFFLPEETSRPGSSPVVVLSFAFWQQYFGGAKDIAGRLMVLNRIPFTIIGVADQETRGPLVLKADVWIPYTMQALTRPGEPLIQDSNTGWIQVFARKRNGIADAQMRAEMVVLGQQSLAAHGSSLKATVTVSPGAFLNYPMVMHDGLPVAAILFLAVSLVLLVACANVANMLLARGFGRRREIAIRLSIGAGKRRLLAQLLAESLVLGAAGGALGLGLAQLGSRLVLAAIPSSEIGPHQLDLSPDWRILAYTLGLSLVTSLVFGLLPALALLRVDLTPALKSGGMDSTGKGRRQRLQHSLIAVQVAVCLMLLVNAGLLLRGARNALHLDTGSALHDVLIVSLDLRQQQYSPEQAERFFTSLRREVASLPGINSAALTDTNPQISSCGRDARAVLPDHTATQPFSVACENISPDYFRTTGIALLQGREFTEADLRTKSAIVVIDESFAKRYFAGRNPLGQLVRIGDRPQDDNPKDDHQVVGVVATVRKLQVGSTPKPWIYTPLRGLRYLEAKMLVSYRGPYPPMMRSLAKNVTALDPNLNVRVQRIEENVEAALAPVRIGAAAAATLGGLGLLLACTGVYGVMSFLVGSRRREVGIRVALGAKNADILRLILWQGMKPVAIGAVIGLPLAAAGAQLIRVMLYGLSPMDPLPFLSMAALLALMAAIAALVPARAALRVDPAVTLREN